MTARREFLRRAGLSASGVVVAFPARAVDPWSSTPEAAMLRKVEALLRSGDPIRPTPDRAGNVACVAWLLRTYAGVVS